MALKFSTPPNWPAPPDGWSPPPDWSPDPSWGPAPQDWQFWVEDHGDGFAETSKLSPENTGEGGAAPLSAVGKSGLTTWVARHKVLTGAGVLVLLIVVIGAIAGGSEDDPADPLTGPTVTQEDQGDKKTDDEIAAEKKAEADRAAEADAQAEAEAAAKEEEARVAEEQRIADEAAAAQAAAAEAARIGTVAQQNAHRSAENYLGFTAFSRSGLVGQLEFEGFSAADAEFAIARLEAEGGVDWNAQAAASAANYLSLTAFSRAGLIDQLIFEGFTTEQAQHGVSTTGL